MICADGNAASVANAAAIIKETAHPDVNLIFGAVIDPNLGDEIRITVIATGFARKGMSRRMLRSRMAANANINQSEMAGGQNTEREMADAELQPASFNTEDLDIPTFLRRRVGK